MNNVIYATRYAHTHTYHRLIEMGSIVVGKCRKLVYTGDSD